MVYSPQHLDRLRLRHLRLLELIDRHRSLRAVGKVLNLTQPAVSQMVKDLEYAFGVMLVERSVRGVTLSAAGRQALQRIRSGLATFDHLASELQADLPLTVRIGTNPALMFQLMPDTLRRLASEQGRMRFTLRTGMVGDMLQALWDGDLDCYVGRVDWDQMPPRMAAVLHHDPLTQTELVLACSTAHPLARGSDLSVRDLADWPWALPPADSNNRIELEAGLRNHGLPAPMSAVEIAADPNALVNLAKQLELLVCVPRVALDAHVEAGALCVLDLPDFQFAPIQIGFVTLAENEDMEPLQVLRRALVDAAREGEKVDPRGSHAVHATRRAGEQ
jgi:DNA-binding transcriptional LysR family regulator